MNNEHDDLPPEGERSILIKTLKIAGVYDFAVAEDKLPIVWKIYACGKIFASTDVYELRKMVEETRCSVNEGPNNA